MSEIEVAFGTAAREITVAFGGSEYVIEYGENTQAALLASVAAAASAADASASLAAIQALLATSAELFAAVVLEFAQGHAGAIYQVDRSTCFSDVAGTTPVTGTGQSVACIVNVLGDSDYDLIQADATKRGTYFEAYGMGFVRCGNGKGYYSRATVALLVPSFLAVAATYAGTNGRALFGLVKNTNTRHLLYSATLSRINASANGDAADLTRALSNAYTANYSAPSGPVGVYHSLLDGGQLDAFFEDSEELSSLEEVATTWADLDTVAGLTLGLNIGSQALGIGVPNADASCDFYGAVALSKFPGNRQAIVRWLQSRSRPEVTADDEVILIVGDSTGDDVGTSVSDVVEEVFLRFARDELTTRRPNNCVLQRDWVRTGEAFQGFQRHSDGTKIARTFVINCSSAGSQPGYFFGERFDRAIGWLPKIDTVIWNHGQNLVSGDATIHGNADRHLLRAGQWIDAQEQLRGAYPDARHMMVRPYPVGIDGDTTIDVAVDAVDYVADKYGDVDLIDFFTRFDTGTGGDSRPAAWYEADHVHPSVPDGVDEMLDVLVDAFDALAALDRVTPPITEHRKVAASENLLANGGFEDWTAGAPDDWSVYGDGAVEKVGAQAKVTGANGGIEQTINCAALQGQTVTLLVRQRIVAGSDLYAGGVVFKCNNGVGSNIGDGRWHDFPYKTWDAERAFIYQFPVPATATTLTVQIRAGLTGAGTIYLDRAVLVAGDDPRDLLGGSA